MTKRRGFGADLEPILPTPESHEATRDEAVTPLPIGDIHPNPYQPRRQFDERALEELSASIRKHGVLQPVIVRPRPDGGYWLVAGERRWRAAKLAGLQRLPAVIRDIPDREALAIALVENLQREDLNPLDEALSLRRLIDEFELSHQEAADTVGRSRAAVSNLLRLLDLNQAVQGMLTAGELDMGHARALLALEPSAQLEHAHKVRDGQLNVRQTERLVRRALAPPRSPPVAVQPTTQIPLKWRHRVSISQSSRGTQVTVRDLSDTEVHELLAWLADRDT